jgi:outer membrane receptor protein involved in Fe transport
MRTNFKYLLLGTVSMMSVTAAPAFAQEAAADEVDPNEIVVTAQKKAENLQDVPIAVSAFSQDSLEGRGLNGGSDLVLAIPNVSFSSVALGKYNFQIRGIGAQIQGASSDSGVGIHQNNIPLTINRLAAAEFYDIERVEVLRGPQGTLYGRNATGGVVNTITATPKDEFSAEVSLDYGRYDRKKVSGYINIPLSDSLAVRAAGTMIKRDGTILNAGTGNMVDSRDVWSTRVTAQFEPSDNFRARLMWEHFEQDDTSGAIGKTICATTPGVTSIGGVATNPFTSAMLTPGCLRTSVNDARNTGMPSSTATLPGLFGLLIGVMPLNGFQGKVLSRDLRTIESSFDPYTRAKNDLISLDLQIGLGDSLTLTSVSAYSKDKFSQYSTAFGGIATVPFANTPLTPGGLFTDPQLGASDRFENSTLVRNSGKQYSQELRIQSDFAGPLNFNLGGIYLDFKSQNEVLYLGNTTTLFAIAQNFGGAGIYIDPLANPDGTGHNYYNNKSPYHLKSAALFGEGYFQASDTLKFTLGLRYTNDRKEQTSFPTLLLAPGRGFPATAPQTVKFEEVTGRFTVDWKATDDNLLYASVARGYKGGGFNPGATALSGVSPAFAPEFVNSIEIGSKNTFADGAIVFNATGFYYDYSGYQVSKFANQTVSTDNVDATVKGFEIEAAFEPVSGLRFDSQIGYLNTNITGGTSIDVHDRTQGNSNLVVVRSIDPGSFGVSCVVPVAVAAGLQAAINGGQAPSEAMAVLCTGANAFPGANAGIAVNLKGKELPNAPHWTMSFGAQYTMEFGSEWEGVIRADYFRQTSSFARIYNSEIDGIDGYDNINLSYRISSQDKGIDIMFYARNLLSQDVATVVQVGGEETGGTRTIFGKDRATYGISLTKRF